MNVGCVGFGLEPFSRHSGTALIELGVRAAVEAVRTSGLERSDIGVAYVGSSYTSDGLGQRILKELDLVGIPIHNLENACASGSDAVLHAARAVEHGEAGAALAIGLDAPTLLAAKGPLPLSDEDWLVRSGITAPAVYALRARAYLDRYDVPLEHLAAVSVKNRRHGAANPVAPYGAPVTVEEVLASPMISDPLTRLQCCPVTDGAGAIVLAASGKGQALANVVGGAVVSGSRQDEIEFRDDASERAAERALDQAGIGPDDIDLCEVHDAFTIGEVLAIEALGVIAEGEAATRLAEGAGWLGSDGTIVNPSGGLLARGHPPGATGVAQVVEAMLQLSGRAGTRQIPGARVAVTHTRGGGTFDLAANACAVLVLRRM